MNREIVKLANSCARRSGYQKATDIVFRDVPEFEVVRRAEPGYRKKTTGERVPRAYLRKFGWKNTYYQSAVTVVAAPLIYRLLPDAE
jgi:hypothetical protein